MNTDYFKAAYEYYRKVILEKLGKSEAQQIAADWAERWWVEHPPQRCKEKK